MPKLTDAPRLLGLFIQIFVSHSILLLWLTINISSCSWMIIPVMVLSNSFVRSLTLWRLSKLSKLKLSFNTRKKIKVVHYDRDGEYYGKYDEKGCNPGPFCSIYNDWYSSTEWDCGEDKSQASSYGAMYAC